MSKQLMKGNEALALAAIKAGCSHFFGYPITPQNEIPEYLARELPVHGGVFLQAESELAAINMVFGASAAGARVLTTSSSPGIALMQEGISLLAAAQLPCVIVNVQRGGPGIGGIQPSQADYYQMTRGGGNGDYRVPSFAPASVQESAEMMIEAFELADQYRTPFFIVSDGVLGQMMEPVEFSESGYKKIPEKEWKVSGHANKRAPLTIKTLALAPEILEQKNLELQNKYKQIEDEVTRWESYRMEKAEIVAVAYGTTSRIVKNAIDLLHDEIKVGLIRPKTLWPFPKKPFQMLSERVKKVLCVEMSCGQMIDDVRLAVNGQREVGFYGRMGGVIPTPEEVAEAMRAELREVVS
jgi:2-oxoglutarate/2-oxoacid ferredoxin oxidoreductase subunit alpha